MHDQGKLIFRVVLTQLQLVISTSFLPTGCFALFTPWSFVVALPGMATPGAEFTGKTYLAPALFVQVRDIALSGMMFVLNNLGSGVHSLDERLFGKSVGLVLTLKGGGERFTLMDIADRMSVSIPAAKSQLKA